MNRNIHIHVMGNDLFRVGDQPPNYTEYQWPLVVKQMRRKGYRLKLQEHADGWNAAFCPLAKLVDDVDWQAKQFESPGHAVCHAALDRCRNGEKPALPELNKEEVHAIDCGGRIMAVKMYRTRTGLGLKESKGAVDAVTVLRNVDSLKEDEFLKLYAKVVDLAKAYLDETNKTCGDDWPAGSKWDQLAGSSKAIFMTRARKCLLISDEMFLAVIRNWPYTESGEIRMQRIFDGIPEKTGMDANDVKPGLRVKTVKLQSADGMMIKPHHLSVRKEGVTGTVERYVPGHGGDVWFVQHDDSEDVGAYCFTEIEYLPLEKEKA